MAFLVTDPFTAEQFELETRALANSKALEIYALMVERESYIFTINKKVVEGSSTTWVHADLDNDPEEGLYYIYNPFTVGYDDRSSLSSAKAWMQDLKDVYMSKKLTRPAVIEKGSAA